MKRDDDIPWPMLSLRSGGASTERTWLIDWVSLLLGLFMVPAAVDAWMPDTRVVSLFEALSALVNGTIHVAGTTVVSATFITMFVHWLEDTGRSEDDSGTTPTTDDIVRAEESIPGHARRAAAGFEPDAIRKEIAVTDDAPERSWTEPKDSRSVYRSLGAFGVACLVSGSVIAWVGFRVSDDVPPGFFVWAGAFVGMALSWWLLPRG